MRDILYVRKLIFHINVNYIMIIHYYRVFWHEKTIGGVLNMLQSFINELTPPKSMDVWIIESKENANNPNEYVKYMYCYSIILSSYFTT